MENTVTMRLKNYDDLKDNIDYLQNKIKEMEEDRIKELKEIFKLRESINDIDIKIDYGNIVKELYGAEIKIDDITYKFNEGINEEEIIYNVWLKED